MRKKDKFKYAVSFIKNTLKNNDWVLNAEKNLKNSKNVLFDCKAYFSDNFQHLMVKYGFSKKKEQKKTFFPQHTVKI